MTRREMFYAVAIGAGAALILWSLMILALIALPYRY